MAVVAVVAVVDAAAAEDATDVEVQEEKINIFWTHGLTGHNRRECNSPAQGHQGDATLENRMGGSNKGCLA